jgi:hypothetical protein
MQYLAGNRRTPPETFVHGVSSKLERVTLKEKYEPAILHRAYS